RDLRCVNLALLVKWRWRLLAGAREFGETFCWLDMYLWTPLPILGVGRWVLGRLRLGGGMFPFFEPWFGGTPLRVHYPRFFQVSQQRDSKVGEMGNWHDATRIFSVKSVYSVLVSNLGVIVASHVVPDQVLAKVWKSWEPSKVIVFSLQLLQDRILTRQNLFRRKVIRDFHNTLCILRGTSAESADNLFLNCDLSFSA
ncbi:pantothenate synthetase, partial [Trifolium medium]|nr:pantothenate synthetase [Trifolium medium]